MRIRFPLPFGAREQRQALFCASLLFFVVSGFIILKSVRDAYFLSLYSSRSLPYFMALNTAVSAVTAAIYLRIYRKYVLSRVVRASLAVFSFGTFLFYLLIDPTHHATIGLLYIWVGIFGTIAPVQAWALVIQQISTRQARRAMGIIGAGAIFGSVGGGFVARLVTGPYGVDALLPFAALAIAIALIFSVPLAAVREEHEQTQLSLAEDHSRRRKRFVIMMLLLVATGTVVSAFIDFQFKTLSQQRYVTARSLAEFFGSFYAYLGASTMVFQLVATPLLMRRFGVAGTLTVLPLFLLIENGLVFVLGLFGAAVLMRGSEELLRHSVDRSSLEVLYAALPEKTRIRIKSLIDTIGVRVPEGIAALVLVALFSVGRAEMSLLFVVNAVLLATWILLAYLLGRREYPGVLREEIERKAVDFESVRRSLFNQSFYRLLPEIFRNADRETIMSLLGLLESSKKKWLGRYLAVALVRQEPEIKSKVLRVIFLQDADLSTEVRKHLNDPDENIRRETIHYLAMRGALKSDEVAELRSAKDLRFRIALVAFDLRKRSIQPFAYEKLEALLDEAIREEDETARIEAAHVLEFSRGSNVPSGLYQKLLSDSQLSVRKAALQGIERTTPAGVISSLLRLSRNIHLRADVTRALVAYGSSLAPHLQRMVQSGEVSLPQKKLAIRIATQIGGSNVVRFLFRVARDPDLALRFTALKGLNRLKRTQNLQFDRKAVLPLLSKESEWLETELGRFALCRAAAGPLTRSVMQQHLLWGFERVFRLLGLLDDSDSVYFAYLGWMSGDTRQVDAALELLEQVLEPDVRKTIFPLLEAYYLEQEDAGAREDNQEQLSVLEMADDSLLLAAALYESEVSWFHEAIASLKESPITKNQLVTEIVEWRKRKMQEQQSNNDESLNALQKIEHLSQIDIFARLGPEELLVLANQTSEEHFAAGKTIFKTGDPAQQLFSLVEGAVELNQNNEYIGHVRPGESFGDMEILSNGIRMYTAVATEECRCLKIDRESFWEIVEDYPAVSRGILEGLVHKVQNLTDRLAASHRINVDVVRKS